ncbi:MAG: DUF59 domain-containing protein [Anaerolineales bacterium]|nr:DUF59 domain-containing protein [Anaerolineales bacterium]
MNVVELGLIRNIEIKNKTCQIEMIILTTPFCPYAPALLRQVMEAANSAARMKVMVEMGAEMWDPSMMEGGADGDGGLYRSGSVVVGRWLRIPAGAIWRIAIRVDWVTE